MNVCRHRRSAARRPDTTPIRPSCSPCPGSLSSSQLPPRPWPFVLQVRTRTSAPAPPLQPLRCLPVTSVDYSQEHIFPHYFSNDHDYQTTAMVSLYHLTPTSWKEKTNKKKHLTSSLRDNVRVFGRQWPGLGDLQADAVYIWSPMKTSRSTITCLKGEICAFSKSTHCYLRLAITTGTSGQTQTQLSCWSHVNPS